MLNMGVTPTPPPTNTPAPTHTPGPTNTPGITPTPAVADALDRNIFRPGHGPPLQILVKPLVSGHLRIRVYNLFGSNMCQPFEGDLPAAVWFQATWNGSYLDGQTVASGVYFVSIQGCGIHSVRKVVLVR